MVQNTLDSFINQKLDEKSKRIASIWDRNNITNNYSVNDALDPMEIKFNLINNADELLKMRLDLETDKLKRKLSVAEDKYNSFSKLEYIKDKLEKYRTGIYEQAEQTYNNLIEYIQLIDKYEKEKQSAVYQKKNEKDFQDLKDKIQDTANIYLKFKTENDILSLFEFAQSLNRRSFEIEITNDDFAVKITYEKLIERFKNQKYASLDVISSWDFGSFKGYYQDSKKLERLILKPYGLTILDSFSHLRTQFESEYNELKNGSKFYETEEYKKQLKSEIELELEKRSKGIGEIEDRVNDFANTNVVLSYPFDDETAEVCDIPTYENKKDREYVKDQLKVDEYFDFEDVSKKIITKKFAKIQDFLMNDQVLIVKENITEFTDVIYGLYKTIPEIPELYATEKIKMRDKIAYLHYFGGATDVYIVELEKLDIFDEDKKIQGQAFGWVILNNDFDNAELGYIDINEIKQYYELDFHFQKTNLGELIDKHNPYLQEQIAQQKIATEKQTKHNLFMQRVRMYLLNNK
jgi:hypothetical protein